MKEMKFLRKISLMILMLVVSLTTFCYAPKKVFADNLTSLEVIGYENSLDPAFNPNVYNYSIKIPNNELDLYFNYEKENSADSVTITGNRYLKNSTGLITIKVGNNKSYNISFSREDLSLNYDYSCTKDVQYFNTPIAGRYILETWGAQGAGYDLPGNTYASYGGKGGYSKGVIKLKTSDEINGPFKTRIGLETNQNYQIDMIVPENVIIKKS